MEKKRPKSADIAARIVLAWIVITGLVTAAPAAAATLKVISGFPQTHLFTKECIGTFEKNLKELSGGKMNINFHGPDVIPTNEQFQPLQAGVFDLLFTHSAYHLGTTAAGAAIEAIKPDPVKRRESGIIDYVDGQYHQLGVKLLAVLPMAQYNIVLKEPIGKRSPSLKGLKIRTASLVAPVIKALGGAPVNIPPGEIYTSLQKGVIDGFTLVAVGLMDIKTHEVAGYLARPMFGFISGSIFMNLEKYNNLTDQEKKWIESAAVKSEIDAMELFKITHENEVAELKAKGMKETRLQVEDARKMDHIFSGTIWTVAEKKSGRMIKELRKLAEAKGML